jgi:hypothetical protein
MINLTQNHYTPPPMKIALNSVQLLEKVKRHCYYTGGKTQFKHKLFVLNFSQIFYRWF